MDLVDSGTSLSVLTSSEWTGVRFCLFTLGIRHYRVGDKISNGYRVLPTVKAVE